jgi:formylglycine-generating enzyme required for sulfatase activity
MALLLCCFASSGSDVTPDAVPAVETADAAIAEVKPKQNADPVAPAVRTAASLPKPKADLVIDLGGGVTMKFVLILPGAFIMGSDKSRFTDEQPVHKVTITKPFYLGKYEVTQEQWEAVMGDNVSLHKGPKYPDSAKRPVENVPWNYSQVFLARLKEKVSGYDFRLPTEAQWEYACRAGATHEYSFGDDAAALGEHAWYSSNADGQTHPVGGKKPNAWGLYDMHGNVWEWCSDGYGPYSQAAQSDPVGPGSSPTRVLRGGAWNNVAEHLRSAYRHDLEPNDGYRFYGLRCVAVSRSDP